MSSYNCTKSSVSTVRLKILILTAQSLHVFFEFIIQSAIFSFFVCYENRT